MRQIYLDRLIGLRNKELIKVISGVRRCGKSTLMELYLAYLKSTGVQDPQIIYVNLEEGEFLNIETHHQLYDYVNPKIQAGEMTYILIDEVQRIPQFQKAVDALFAKPNCDVYITGSNAMLLSGELATLLAGRYMEIKMLPLSFKEYVSAFPESNDLERLYTHYLTSGAFPFALQLPNAEDRRQYLTSVLDSIVVKDVLLRGHMPDYEMLLSVLRFVFDNVGNLVSANKIANTMTSYGRKLSVHTVENYLHLLTRSFVLYKVGRYDIAGKQYLKTGDKYYTVDTGLRASLIGTSRSNWGHLLENVVFLELLRRGYEVSVGKVGQTEVDFIAQTSESVEYYQVAYTVTDADGKILDRELNSLNSIKDHNPKFLLTMDKFPPTSHSGIKQLNALDWLLEDTPSEASL
jgi:predicted AAA+ superfamily ATPase